MTGVDRMCLTSPLFVNNLYFELHRNQVSQGLLSNMSRLSLNRPVVITPLSMVVESMDWLQFCNMEQYLHVSDAIPSYSGRPGWVWLHLGTDGDKQWFSMRVYWCGGCFIVYDCLNEYKELNPKSWHFAGLVNYLWTLSKHCSPYTHWFIPVSSKYIGYCDVQ